MKLVYVLLCVLSCGFGSLATARGETLPQKLAALEMLYHNKLQTAVREFDQETLWPSASDCDGTLWAGIALAGGVPLDLRLAEHRWGEIHRRPYTPCWNPEEGDVGSRSTVSNDMLLGYLLGLWSVGDYSAIHRLASYGESHQWVMGQPLSQAGAVVLKPNQIGVLGRMLEVLSGGRDSRYRYSALRLVYSPVEAGSYHAHLQALSIILNLQIRSELDPWMNALVEPLPSFRYWVGRLVASNPLNPLGHLAAFYLNGDPEPVVDLLLDPQTPVPDYVRGDRAENYWLGEWLFVAKQILAATL